MGKFSGCLLAADFDGTLADSAGQILPCVREKLRYYIENDGLFTVCTGRTKQGFHLFSPEIINAPVLLANGIMAYDYALEKTVFSCSVSRADAVIADLIAEAFPEICIELYSETFRSYAIHPNERSERHFAAQDISWREIGSVKEAETPLVKIMLSIGQARVMEVQRFLDGVLGAYPLKYIPSTGDYVEIIRKESDKGIGLLTLARTLGIPEDHVFAVGDGDNDLEMLRAAEIGFVPANGSPLAKAAGSMTVCSNDEGAVAQVIGILEENISQKGK